MSKPTADSFEALFVDAVCGMDSSLEPPLERPAALPVEGAIIAERYRLGPLLGQGGMGCVYAAQHLLTGKRVAIKWLRDDAGKRREAALRMLREARTAGRVHHAHVVGVYDAGFVDEHPFIVMELLEGESLEQRLARGPLAPREAIDVVLQVARGVAAAHALGIIHRDLKPANIFLCREDAERGTFVKVLDFGISKLLREVDEDLSVTAPGAPVGTPMFMSPEQIRGDALDERVDVYALAVTLYFALTRRFPFEGRTRGELFARILTAPPEPIGAHLRSVAPRLASAVTRGLERDPARRYANMGEFSAALADACEMRPPVRLRTLAVAALAFGTLVQLVLSLSAADRVIGSPARPASTAPSRADPRDAPAPPASSAAPAIDPPAAARVDAREDVTAPAPASVRATRRRQSVASASSNPRTIQPPPLPPADRLMEW